MSHWFDILYKKDYKMMRSIYGEDYPNLEDSFLIDTYFDLDGNAIVLSIDMRKFPTRPPKKWTAKNFNSVKFDLHFNSIETLKMNGWIYEDNLPLSVRREGKSIFAKYGDENNGFQVHFTHMWINNIMGCRSDI
jgi:hypothetical protein